MMNSGSLWVMLVLAAPAASEAVALVARRHPGRAPQAVISAGSAAAVTSLLVAVGAAVAIGVSGTRTSPTLGVDGIGASIRLDALSVTMLVMIAVLGAVVFRFSATYLQGDNRHGRFLGQISLTIAVVEVLVLSGNLVLLIAAWIGTSLALHRLLVFYGTGPELGSPRARSSLRRASVTCSSSLRPCS